MVVLPAPVGPTMAIVWPGSATRLTSLSTGWSGTYSALTWSNSTRPLIGGIGTAPGASCRSGTVSSRPKMRSPPAMALWMFDHSTEICAIGWLKRCVYAMNATITPSDRVEPKTLGLFSSSHPPTPATMAIDT